MKTVLFFCKSGLKSFLPATLGFAAVGFASISIPALSVFSTCYYGFVLMALSMSLPFALSTPLQQLNIALSMCSRRISAFFGMLASFLLTSITCVAMAFILHYVGNALSLTDSNEFAFYKPELSAWWLLLIFFGQICASAAGVIASKNKMLGMIIFVILMMAMLISPIFIAFDALPSSSFKFIMISILCALAAVSTIALYVHTNRVVVR